MLKMRVLAVSSILGCVGLASSALAAPVVPVPFRSGTTVLERQTATDLAARAEALRGTRVLVQFEAPLTPAQKKHLLASGVELLAPLGANAWYARLGQDAGIAGALRADGAASVRRIERKWKLHPDLEAGAFPDWSIVNLPGADQPGEPTVAVGMMLHRDVPMARGVEVVRGLGGVVRDRLETVNGMMIELPVGAIRALAEADEVMWVEPPLPQLSAMNAENRALVQANEVQAAPYNLSGTGVRVLVYDAGSVLATHQDFINLQGQQRVTVRDGAAVSFHPTHVAGTIGGDGGQSSGTSLRGMAPNVRIDSYTFEYAGAGTFLYTNPGDLEDDYTDSFVNNGSAVSNNSIGTNVAQNGFSCSIEGDYGITPAVIDALVRGETLGFPIRVVWSAGNERGAGSCGTQYGTVPPPATNKNAVVVGAVDSDTDVSTSFSSWGPTDDGRLKPDVTGPGCQIGGDGGVTSTWSDGGYGTICGTSMSGPTVTGCAALMLQDFRAMHPGSPDFRNSTLKAVLTHTAVDVGNPGPDYKHGYGSVRVKDAIDFMRTGRFVESEVDQGGVYTVFVTVAAGEDFAATLAWDDPAGNPVVTDTLVNDLDLAVFDPSDTRRFPFTLNPASPSSNAVATQEDHVNNMEQVRVAGAAAGTWRIEVRGTDVAVGPQPFSLTASPSLVAMTLSPAASVPSLVPPGTPFDVDVNVSAFNQSVVSNSVKMFFRATGAGAFTPINMTALGGGLFRATVPALSCGDEPEIYFAAEGSVTGQVLSPSGAPASAYAFGVGVVSPEFQDNAESDTGWTLGVPGDTATTGAWVRANPVGSDAQPEDDHSDPGAICFVTANGPAGGGVGDADVDGGLTTLISPAFDLSDADSATVSYWRWYSNNAGAAPGADVFRVDISNNNGGSWVNAETVGPTGSGTTGGWVSASFDVGSLITMTSQMRVRFIAEDADSGSIVEAAVDDFLVEVHSCVDVTPPCPGDVSGPGGVPDGAVNVDDLNAILGSWNSAVGIGSPLDLAGNDGVINVDDLNVLLGNWASACP